MHYRSRRRLDVLFLALGGLALAIVAAIVSAIGDTERIGRYWVAADVTDGLAEVVEVIDYDFGSNRRHGIYRDVPGLDPTAPIEVSSPSAPDEFVVQAGDGGETRIRIGDPGRTISGRHRYRIDYPVDIGAGGGRLAWDAVGTGWSVDMDAVEIHLTGETAFTDLQCSTGRTGAWGGCRATQPEPGHLVVTLDGLDAGEGVTLWATPGQPLASPPSPIGPPTDPVDDPGAGIVLPAGVALVGGLLGAAAASRQVRRGGRELVWAGGAADAAYGPQRGQDFPTRLVDHAELSELASIEFAPPKGLHAWQGGVLHRESAGEDQQVAWLLERAADGQIGFSGVATTGEGDSGDVVLHRLAEAPHPEDENGLRGLFGGRRSVALGAYDKQFAAGWGQLAQRLDRWQDQSPFWDPSGDRRRTEARVVGAIALVLGLAALVGAAVLASRFGAPWLAGVALAAALGGVGWSLLVRSWELRVRTPEGSGLWILTESFRRFIEQSDAQHVEAAAREGRLREYTAWATALGEADHWRDVVSEADLDPSLEPAGVGQALLATHLLSATSKASTAPSSSGGGGGGVGGGGGGGGGGSW
jgi:hypothetical protein